MKHCDVRIKIGWFLDEAELQLDVELKNWSWFSVQFWTQVISRSLTMIDNLFYFLCPIFFVSPPNLLLWNPEPYLRELTVSNFPSHAILIDIIMYSPPENLLVIKTSSTGLYNDLNASRFQSFGFQICLEITLQFILPYEWCTYGRIVRKQG